MRITLLTIFITLFFSGISQVTESDTTYVHSAKKASILSAVLPGAGQVYNKKYWKAPIVYAGLGISIYYLDRNLKEVKFFRNEIKTLQDDDPTTNPSTGGSEAALNNVLNNYKSLRDWSYVAIGAVYVLQILDASVDANLFNFDVNEDLSLTVLPYMNTTAAPAAGLHLALKF